MWVILLAQCHLINGTLSIKNCKTSTALVAAIYKMKQLKNRLFIGYNNYKIGYLYDVSLAFLNDITKTSHNFNYISDIRLIQLDNNLRLKFLI